MRPGIAAEASEVFVEASAIRDVQAAAIPKTGGLHLANARESGIGAHGVAGLRSGRVDVHRTEAIDAACRIDADDTGRFLAQLALNGEAVLNLIRDFGVG